MKNQKKISLAAYSTMAASGLLVPHIGHTQILYTDIDPDSVAGAYDYVHLDIDQDGTNDFMLNGFNALWYNGIAIYYSDFGDSVMGTAAFSSWIQALSAGDSIGPDQGFGLHTFMASVFDYYGSIIPKGEWVNAADNYIGVRKIVATDTMYGWIRLATEILVDPPHTVTYTIKDFAIQMTPNTAILAGDTTDEVILETPQAVNPLPDLFTYNDQIHINMNGVSENATLQIFDVSGKSLYFAEFNGDRNISDYRLASGIYLARLSYGDEAITKKIIIM